MKNFALNFVIILLILINCVASFSAEEREKVIIDSDLSLEEALTNKNFPDSVREQLKLIEVDYYSFDGKLHRGQLVVHKDLASEVVEIFEEIQIAHFPIEKAVPIVQYNWSDMESMKDNNSSAFNYRRVAGTNKLSMHATGRAIDINPLLNPYIKGENIEPPGAVYDPTKSGTITDSCIVVKTFEKRGWTWGGRWITLKDYQHFQKK